MFKLWMTKADLELLGDAIIRRNLENTVDSLKQDLEKEQRQHKFTKDWNDRAKINHERVIRDLKESHHAALVAKDAEILRLSSVIYSAAAGAVAQPVKE